MEDGWHLLSGATGPQQPNGVDFFMRRKVGVLDEEMFENRLLADDNDGVGERDEDHDHGDSHVFKLDFDDDDDDEDQEKDNGGAVK
ncbi:hypothetical protein RvY_11642 [Ramazzottius varieornatus]|uniref:Uncharacterized protein n=1 Tax=Ramazzottius varieornatus TaxID=947166 RepID=A0A1D1VGV3_RAMVA|nr:hypothetical protein RvY_11642 [Ramazzottius varieornatus]